MNSLGKWLVRGAMLVVLLGFVLPSVTVSCTVLPGAEQTLSTAQMASMEHGQPILFLLPFGAVVALVLAFLPANTRTMFFVFLAGQVAGILLGLFGLSVGMIYFYSEVQKLGGVDVTAEIGLFVLVLGYGIAGVGIVLQILEGLKMPSGAVAASSGLVTGGQVPALMGAVPARPPNDAPATSVPSGARLEVTRGPMANRSVQVKGEVFTIGRGPGNDLQLMDKAVSRQHARIRFGQGVWFLQDQNSASGTRVNGKAVTATRLNSGDQITIGDTTMVFRK